MVGTFCATCTVNGYPCFICINVFDLACFIICKFWVFNLSFSSFEIERNYLIIKFFPHFCFIQNSDFFSALLNFWLLLLLSLSHQNFCSKFFRRCSLFQIRYSYSLRIKHLAKSIREMRKSRFILNRRTAPLGVCKSLRSRDRSLKFTNF